MKHAIRLSSLLAAALIVGCAGGHDSAVAPPPATGLAYANPATTSADWSLVKDASSTGIHLVLDLVGPSDGTKYRGVGFTLQADTSLVEYARFQDAKGNPAGYYTDGGVFRDVFSTLYNTAPTDLPPTLQASGISNGQLMVGIFQKTDDETWTAANAGVDGSTAKACGRTVLQVALDFDPAAGAAPQTVALAVVKARVIPEHVDTYANRMPVPVPIKVGTLTLQ
jgi:hypothetical protein